MPQFDTTISITTLLAICAIVSPIFVAVINNIHSSKLRKLEIGQELRRQKIEIIYQDKKNAYMSLESAAGNFLSDPKSINKYAQLISAINASALLCSTNHFPDLNRFRSLATAMHKGHFPGDTNSEYLEYVDLLSVLSYKLNGELASDSEFYS